LFAQISLVAIAAVFIIGLTLTPAYAKTVNIQTSYEASGLPLCGGEDIDFSGTPTVPFSQ